MPAADIAVVPVPVSVERTSSEPFVAATGVAVVVTTTDAGAMRSASLLASLFCRAIGAPVPVRTSADGAASVVTLTLDPAFAGGDEGYALAVTASAVTLTARSAAGLFYGVQTIRQLLPYAAEYDALITRTPKRVTVPAMRVMDRPRYEWRGAMLDVSRHFFSVTDVKRFIDLAALYKLNRLHLHLSDDQGWRIEIKSRPRLTEIGGRSQVGGGGGGFYTQEQYADIVAYAADRFVTIVPEIDMPGHTNAALSAYAELNCSGTAPAAYTGIEVGFSALCPSRDTTYAFIDDVVREIAALTPGAWFHIGGDEVRTLERDAYAGFVRRVHQIVASHGKTTIGWDEIASVGLDRGAVVQHWRPRGELDVIGRSPQLIMSPAVEAPLWSETMVTMRDVEFLAFPRLAAVAEVGWSPAASRSWDTFRIRLGAQAPRWIALGVNFYRAPEIDWQRIN
jgi:hexosaminidase